LTDQSSIDLSGRRCDWLQQADGHCVLNLPLFFMKRPGILSSAPGANPQVTQVCSEHLIAFASMRRLFSASAQLIEGRI